MRSATDPFRRWLFALATSLASVALVAPGADASSDGIYDASRTGCTCHGLPQTANLTTQLIIDGLPDGQNGRPSGYTAGETYRITVWVLGAAAPPGGLNLRGFNLEVGAGRLTTIDDTAQANNTTECQLRMLASPCDPSTNCGVQGAEPCTTLEDCIARRCTSPGTGDCRLCTQTVVRAQATHTSAGGLAAETPAAELTNGNSVLMWQLDWRAPSPAVGDVRFYLAGNVVNGNGGPDPGDVWSVLTAPLVVHQAP